MLKLAALAFLPTASVVFGAMVVMILSFPAVTGDFAKGAWLLYGAAALSVLVSIPIAWLVARRMLSRRERRRLDV
ncbi:MAG: hypothetical protein PSV46_01410 [Reyranella sp.]|nr:hypothetical protein [Reyranella sp.]